MGDKRVELDFTKLNLVRSANNFLQGREFGAEEINLLNEYLVHCLKPETHVQEKKKVGVLLVCINQPYWQYAYPVIEGIKSYFLPGHDTEIMMWSDMPEYPEAKDVSYGVTIFPTKSIEWPYPTLMRYHLFLEQEEYLKKFDYLFYVDLDMRVVNVVGDEILGDGLTAAQHPMYAVRHNLIPPYEPNEESTAYIKRPGKVIVDNGKQRFMPYYYAGGIQGGVAEQFVEAMKSMKQNIDTDLAKGYIAIWNDESHWNKYLADNDPSVVLSPAYVYPDSMIEDYYLKVWGRNYTPRIITLTKPFTTSKEGGQAAAQIMKNL